MRASFATMEFPEWPRDEIRVAVARTAALAGHDYPSGAIDEVTDLAIHAAQSARRTMLETVDRAANAHIAHVAMGLAGSLLIAEIERLHQAMRAAAEARGDKVFEGNLKEMALG